MRQSLIVGTLAVMAGLGVGCSSDDAAVAPHTGGGAGASGAAGSSGAGGRGTGGTNAGASGAGMSGAGGGGAGGASAGGAGNGGGGTGGAAGTAAGSDMGGSGGGVVDPCEGKFRSLPLTVSSAFPTLRICSGGTCTNPPTPYFFTPIPNPDCEQVFPDGGIEPPFADAGSGDAAATDAGDNDGAASADDADAGSSPSVDAALDVSDAGTSGDAGADVSVGTEGGSDAPAESRGVDGASDAQAPSCYEFLYNPACTTGTCWGGVIFTQSAGGIADPGVCIEQGATKITFKAKASRPAARIKFGSIREGMGTTEFFLNITTDWATYEVTIPPGEPYNSYSAGMTGVWNGFSVIVEPQDHPGGTFIFVKDAVWVK